MHYLDRLCAKINLVEATPPPKKFFKVKACNIFDETLSKYITVGSYLAQEKSKGSHYASFYCYLLANNIISKYCKDVTFIRNYNFLYNPENKELMESGQLITYHKMFKNLFTLQNPIQVVYTQEELDQAIYDMLIYLYNPVEDDIDIYNLACFYIYWEFQHIIPVDIYNIKYTLSDYVQQANILCNPNTTDLNLSDTCNRLRVFIDKYIEQAGYSDIVISNGNTSLKREELFSKFGTCQALKITLCYDERANIKGVYSIINQFGTKHFNNLPIEFIYNPDKTDTYTANISDRYQLTFRVYDGAIHLYTTYLNRCYLNCPGCDGMYTFIQIKILDLPVKVYTHNLPQELCNSVVDHKVTELTTIESNSSVTLLSTNTYNYKIIPDHKLLDLPIWYQFNK